MTSPPPKMTVDQNESNLAASTSLDEKRSSMKRSKFSEKHIVNAIRQAESGTPIGDLWRPLGVSEATFHIWGKK